MIAFTKVALPFGCLGNMSPDPVTYRGKRFRTAEALFQSLRFEDEEVVEAIRSAHSPMTAKMIAKKHKSKMTILPQGEQDLENIERGRDQGGITGRICASCLMGAKKFPREG